MRRLVAATTGLLALLGVTVVAGYLFIFSASGDRAAQAAPAGSALYINLYLQPSTGQRMNLFELVGRLPGFRDSATLEQKIHDVTQRLLGDLGLDYAADVRPWLGNQVAVAMTPGEVLIGPPHVLLLVSVRDPASARVAVPRLMGRDGATFTAETYRGEQAMIGEASSYALLPDLLLVADTADGLRAALDADADAAPSLADSAAFGSAMRDLPADHLASVYVDVRRIVSLAGERPVGGYSTAALALVAEPSGLHLDGDVPFDADAAGVAARQAFALGASGATVAQWMPADTPASAVILGLQQSIADLEEQLADDPGFAEARDALNQLRALAAVGLGINFDRDVLPLLDGETGVALQQLLTAGPRGQFLLRPSDPVAAEAALRRMRDALAERGSPVTTRSVRGVTITSVAVPEIVDLAYAMLDGVVVLAFDSDAVAAVVEARDGNATLADLEGYEATFELAGARAGNELWVDLAGLIDASAEVFDPGSEFRDILHQIGELAASATASGAHLEVRSVLTVR